MSKWICSDPLLLSIQFFVFRYTIARQGVKQKSFVFLLNGDEERRRFVFFSPRIWWVRPSRPMRFWMFRGDATWLNCRPLDEPSTVRVLGSFSNPKQTLYRQHHLKSHNCAQQNRLVICISWNYYQILPHFGRKVQTTGITGNHVSFESFLTVQFKSVKGRVDDDFVVHTLTSEPFKVGSQSDRRHGMHCRISYVLHIHGDIPIKHER